MRRSPTPAERRRIRRETGRPVKTTLHIGDLLTDEEMDAARTVYAPRTAKFNAAVAEVQAREAADRATRDAEFREIADKAQAEREAAESADALAELRASNAAAHERIDRLTEAQRVERHRARQDERETGA